MNRPDAAQGTTPDASAPIDARPMTDGAAADARGLDAQVVDAQGVDGASLPDALDSDASTAPYTHTIVIDGVNDFDSADERFASSSGGYFGHVAWDSTFLYVGVEGPDVDANSATRWVQIYVGGVGGTTTGVQYNTQQPSLAFPGKYHVGWRTDNALTQGLRWNTAAWVDAGWDFTGDVFQSGTYVELRIPLADLESPTSLSLHISMINEQGGVEGSYAAVPSTSFADGYDPDYTKYFAFAIGGVTKPTAHAPGP